MYPGSSLCHTEIQLCSSSSLLGVPRYQLKSKCKGSDPQGFVTRKGHVLKNVQKSGLEKVIDAKITNHKMKRDEPREHGFVKGANSTQFSSSA